MFDHYDKTDSIKHGERVRRGGNNNPRHIVKGSGNVPNYRRFLQNLENKAALCNFVSNYLTEKASRLLPEGKSLIVAGGISDGEKAIVINSTGIKKSQELASTHEEADTRIILHTISLAKNPSRVIVQCDDTDVMVLLLYIHVQWTHW